MCVKLVQLLTIKFIKGQEYSLLMPVLVNEETPVGMATSLTCHSRENWLWPWSWCWFTIYKGQKTNVGGLIPFDYCCCSGAKSCPALHGPMYCSMPGFPVPHHLVEFAQVHVHWIGDAIQPSPLLSPSPPAFNLPQHQGLFQWVSSKHQVVKLLKFQLQHQSFRWIFRVDFL